MNSKQIYHKYLEAFWEVMQEQELVMFIVPSSYYGTIICKKSEYDQVLADSMKNQQYSIQKNINSLEELVKLTEDEKKNNLKTSISNDIRYNRLGNNHHSDKEPPTNFNIACVLNLLDKIERTDDKLVFDNLKNLLIHYGDISKTYWSILHAVKDKYGREKSIELFNAIPSKVDEFSKRAHLKTDILNVLTNIKKFFGKDFHQFTHSFVSKRGKQACVSQIGSIDLRDALIQFYQQDSHLLEDYKEAVPSIAKYLEQTEDGDFFLQKSPRIISRIIDLEEFKAVTSIRINKNDEYLELIILFLSKYKQKDKRILTFYTNKAWLNRKDNYINLFVSSNPKDPLPENEFDLKLKSFAKMLNKQNPGDPSDIRPLMDKWWEAEELERELNQNGNKSKKLKL
jgi:hypothetical protein